MSSLLGKRSFADLKNFIISIQNRTIPDVQLYIRYCAVSNKTLYKIFSDLIFVPFITQCIYLICKFAKILICHSLTFLYNRHKALSSCDQSFLLCAFVAFFSTSILEPSAIFLFVIRSYASPLYGATAS